MGVMGSFYVDGVPRVPVLTFAIPCGDVESKCQNLKEHGPAYVSSIAFASDVWLRDQSYTDTKCQVRHTRGAIAARMKLLPAV